jgi:hypothetical protein
MLGLYVGGSYGQQSLVRNTPSHSDDIGVRVILPAIANRQQEAESTHNESLYLPKPMVSSP